MSQNRNIGDASFQIETPLALPDDEVQLWRIELDAIGSQEARWQKLLSADEQTRAARFHFARDRRRFAAGRAVLRVILASYLATDPTALNFAYSAKEKPSLAAEQAGAGLMFNVSHSGGIALLAFARGREVGIDIEHVRSDFDLEAIARRFFSAREQSELFALPPEARVEAFFRCWTRKEAYIKATGDGLSLPLSQFDVSLSDEANALLATRPDAAEAACWQLEHVRAGAGFVAAVCVRGRGWKLRDWM